MARFREQRIDQMSHIATGLKHMSKSIDAKKAKPLTAVARPCSTRFGPKGSIATSPQEVDGNLRDAWSSICRGNDPNPEKLVDEFMRDYGHLTFRRTSKFNLQPVSPPDLPKPAPVPSAPPQEWTCWPPADFSPLPFAAYEWLATLLERR